MRASRELEALLMPNLLTTSNHENPFCLSFVALELSPKNWLASICLYLFLSTYNLLRFFFTVTSPLRQNSAKLAIFLVSHLWAFFFSCLARRLGASLHVTFIVVVREYTLFLLNCSLFSLYRLCVLVAKWRSKTVELLWRRRRRRRKNCE